jgi:DNA-directed RNA polymerase specialized sigma24 family protein
MPAPALTRETLAQMKHQALVQALAHAPHNRLVQNEFVARYEPYLRRTINQAIYTCGTLRYCEQMRGLIDDVVNEIFYRVFRNDCRVLQGAALQYESSIFAYLRAMCQNMVRNYVRDYFSHEPLAHGYAPAERQDEELPGDFIEQIPAEEEPPQFFGVAEACDQAADLWRKQASFAEHMDRNLLIFKLHFIHGYHYDEIARIKGLGLGESGVGNTIARLKLRLQNEASSRRRLLH